MNNINFNAIKIIIKILLIVLYLDLMKKKPMGNKCNCDYNRQVIIFEMLSNVFSKKSFLILNKEPSVSMKSEINI